MGRARAGVRPQRVWGDRPDFGVGDGVRRALARLQRLRGPDGHELYGGGRGLASISRGASALHDTRPGRCRHLTASRARRVGTGRRASSGLARSDADRDCRTRRDGRREAGAFESVRHRGSLLDRDDHPGGTRRSRSAGRRPGGASGSCPRGTRSHVSRRARCDGARVCHRGPRRTDCERARCGGLVPWVPVVPRGHDDRRHAAGHSARSFGRWRYCCCCTSPCPRSS